MKIIPTHKVVVKMMQDHAGTCSVKWHERAVKGKDSRSESGWVQIPALSTYSPCDFGHVT